QLKFPKNRVGDEFYERYPNASYNPYGIYSLYVDSHGNVWFGTSNVGVYLFDGEEIAWMYESHLTETSSGGSFGIRSMSEDLEGNYWICNANYRYALLPNDVEVDGLKPINYWRQTGIENIPEEDLYFYSIESDSNGNLLMFANEDGLWLNDGVELTPVFIEDSNQKFSPTSMYKDIHGTIWFGTQDHGIYKYDGGAFEKFNIK
ncbi:MAG: two-component regulator propeller domain-containing protein, partial [Bacteroidota bacterium]